MTVKSFPNVYLINLIICKIDLIIYLDKEIVKLYVTYIHLIAHFDLFNYMLMNFII